MKTISYSNTPVVPASHRILPYTHANRLAECLELTDKDFNRMICSVESDAAFQAMFYNPYPEDNIITMKRFDFSDLSPHFYMNVKSSFKKQYIEQIGEMYFKRFFIFNDAQIPPENIAANCGIAIDDVYEIRDSLSQAYVPSGRIAEIKSQPFVSPSGEEKDHFIIYFFSPNMAKGVYVIDYQRLSAVQHSVYTAFDKDNIRHILRLLELINLRKTILFKIMRYIVHAQDQFFKTGDFLKRVVLNQKTIAHELCVDKSIISRAIHNRSVVFNGGHVVLKDLCINKKKIILQLIEKIIHKERTISSDEYLRKKLKSRYSISISRRSVAAYRKHLEIPSSFRRVAGR